MLYVLSFLVAVILALWGYYRAKTRHKMKFSEKIPGPTAIPILGNIHQFGLDPQKYFNIGWEVFAKHGTILRVWFGHYLAIGLCEPKHIEVLVNSSKFMDKAFAYNFIRPWLGEGLLTSSGQHWKTHRKILTPAFHFKILETYIEVFDKNAQILIDQLSSELHGEEFDIYPYINLYTLDVICETAMGVTINAQINSTSEYVKAVHSMGDVMFHRLFKPWYHKDFLFQFSTLGREQKKNLAILHGLTNSVIKARRKDLFQASKNQPKVNEEDELEHMGMKRRLNFLDLMIQFSKDGVAFTDEEIREEVDTFMFEGHDTTGSGIVFTIYALSRHQEIQMKVVEEMKQIFGDSDRPATFSDLQNMRYLEMVIKEALRLYPSVPLYARHITENVEIEGYTLPAGTDVGIVPFLLHRNPVHFPDPEKFDPDRFLPENCISRHPYSYLPFSAGPRNCIGQKFAMLELKHAVSSLLRKYIILEGDCKDDIQFVVNLVLKPADGVKVKLRLREK